MYKSRNTVITQLGGTFIFLENCSTRNQNRYFPDFIEQHVEDWQDTQASDAAAADRKPIEEIDKPSVIKIVDSYFFVAGANQVYRLNHKYSVDSESDDDFLAQRLTEAEIEALAVELIWRGASDKFEFSDDEKEAATLLVTIIRNMNLAQKDETFHAFPLGMENFMMKILRGFST